MKSRVHPTYKTKYHVQNWAAYDRALVCRGDITIWVSPAAIAAWEPDGAGTRGAQRKYSDLAIESALTLRLLFHLPLRQTEGFLTSLFVLMGLDLRSPDHTTLSRRGQHLDLRLRGVPRRAGLHLIIDSTGLSIAGAGEWATAKHGGRGTRGWKKGSPKVRVGHFARRTRGGCNARLVQQSVIIPMTAAAEWKPKARRVITRTLLCSPSTRPLVRRHRM